jgi:hypothetical protein
MPDSMDDAPTCAKPRSWSGSTKGLRAGGGRRPADRSPTHRAGEKPLTLWARGYPGNPYVSVTRECRMCDGYEWTCASCGKRSGSASIRTMFRGSW